VSVRASRRLILGMAAVSAMAPCRRDGGDESAGSQTQKTYPLAGSHLSNTTTAPRRTSPWAELTEGRHRISSASATIGLRGDRFSGGA
jgi:hypothetical protein